MFCLLAVYVWVWRGGQPVCISRQWFLLGQTTSLTPPPPPFPEKTLCSPTPTLTIPYYCHSFEQCAGFPKRHFAFRWSCEWTPVLFRWNEIINDHLKPHLAEYGELQGCHRGSILMPLNVRLISITLLDGLNLKFTDGETLKLSEDGIDLSSRI